MFPELKDSLLGNLKSLKKTMTDADWKVSAGLCPPALPSLPQPGGCSINPAGTGAGGPGQPPANAAPLSTVL